MKVCWGGGGVGGVTKEREGEGDPKLNGSQVKPLSSTPTWAEPVSQQRGRKEREAQKLQGGLCVNINKTNKKLKQTPSATAVFQAAMDDEGYSMKEARRRERQSGNKTKKNHVNVTTSF